MAGAHEQLERAEHAEHAAHGHGPSSTNKRIALLIAILALFLAISETLGKGAQTEGLNYNVEASNLWAFFQAKTIRQTAVRTAAETLELTRPQAADPALADGRLILSRGRWRWARAGCPASPRDRARAGCRGRGPPRSGRTAWCTLRAPA